MSKLSTIIFEQITTNGRVTVRDYGAGRDQYQVGIHARGTSVFFYRESEEDALRLGWQKMDEMGGVPVPQAGVDELPVLMGISDGGKAGADGGGGLSDGGAEEIKPAGVLASGNADGVGGGGEAVEIGADGGEACIKDVSKAGDGFGKCGVCGCHMRGGVKVGDVVMYRATARDLWMRGKVSFLAHGVARMESGQLVLAESVTVLTAEEEQGLFGTATGDGVRV